MAVSPRILCTTGLVFFLALAVSLTSSRISSRGAAGGSGGVVLRSRNRLGEEEIRVRYGKYHALEVMVPKLRERGMFYRQVTDGRHFLQGVFQGHGNLIDCDTNRDSDTVRNFLDEFSAKEAEAREHHGTGNVTVTVVRRWKSLDEISRDLLDVSGLRRACKMLHRRLRAQLREQREAEEKIRAADDNAHAAFDRLRGQEMPVIKTETAVSKEKKTTPTSRTSPSTRSSRRSPARSKRSLIYPGTKWCGNGNQALDFHDLGDNVATDKCCRGHDHCPYTIGGFSTRYNLFNYRFHTLSHCQCDEIFRSCLRSAANSVADMVGSVYFNVVGIDCFTLKKIRVCSRRSWWGKCLEYERDFEAELNEPFKY